MKNLKVRPIKYTLFDVFDGGTGFTSVSESWFTNRELAERTARRILADRAAKGLAPHTTLTIAAL